MNLAVVILAAGSGTRMKSKTPKVLHPVAGKPMIKHVTENVLALGPQRTIVVVSKDADDVKRILGDSVKYAEQKEQLGTAHALGQAAPLLSDFNGDILVLNGDSPLIQAKSLEELVGHHHKSDAVATIVTTVLEDPFGYGRIIRDDGKVVQVIEEKEASPEQKQIQEINSGIYCFKSKEVFEKIDLIDADNKKKEYYLTDIVSLLVEQKSLVETFEWAPEEMLGVNSRLELAQASLIIYQRNLSKWLDNGVSIVDPLSTYIESDVEIGTDCIIHPQTYLKGNTRVENGCEIGPCTQITDSKIGAASRVSFSVLTEAKTGANCTIGPYSHLRSGTVLADGAKIGSFSEIKNSSIGKGSKVPHLSYMGDTDIAEDVNVGAGTISCNYDGSKKHKTIIKKGAFIGSDTMLVAPVTIGENAFTGAGSVVGHDVPDDSLAIERTEQKNIPGYSKKKKRKK